MQTLKTKQSFAYFGYRRPANRHTYMRSMINWVTKEGTVLGKHYAGRSTGRAVSMT